MGDTGGSGSGSGCGSSLRCAMRPVFNKCEGGVRRPARRVQPLRIRVGVASPRSEWRRPRHASPARARRARRRRQRVAADALARKEGVVLVHHDEFGRERVELQQPLVEVRLGEAVRCEARSGNSGRRMGNETGEPAATDVWACKP
eukprot:2588273-Pleurochrysis_carterae.AAC.1